MKHVTRTILTLFLGAFAMGSNAQFDIQLNEFESMIGGTDLPPAVNVYFNFTIENTSPQLIPDLTPVTWGVLSGNDTLSVISGVVDLGGGTWAVGQELVATSSYIQFPATPPTQNVCGFVFLTVNPETDSTNNHLCHNYTITTTVNLDLKTSHIAVNVPNDLDSFDIDNGTEQPDPVTDVVATFKNTGNVTLPAGFGIPYTYNFQGTEASYTGFLAADLAPGDSTIRPNVDPSFIIPGEEGDFEICLYGTYGDSDQSNDTACYEWTMIDSYIPPAPVGVEEQGIIADIKMIFANNTLYVSQIRDAMDVNIIDANGRMVSSHRLLEDGNISLLNEAPGVYVVQATNAANGSVSMQKIVVQ